MDACTAPNSTVNVLPGNRETLDERSTTTAAQQHSSSSTACSFGLNYDSYVSFRAIGLIWRMQELTAELVCLLISSLLLVPTLWETNNQDMKPIYPWTARE